jgi:hypothetical protein
VVLKNTNLLTSLHVKDLGRSVAASRNILSIVTEPHTANHTFVVERVDKVDIENALHLRVEDGIPVLARLLVVGSHSINFEIAQSVSHGRSARAPHASVVGSRVANLRRRRVSGIRDWSVNLRSRRSDGIRRSADTSSAGARRGSALRRLRSHTVGDWAWRVALRVRSLLGTGMRGRDRKARGTLTHLVLRSHLLLLRRGMALLRWLLLLSALWLLLLALLLTLLRRCKTSLAATSHYATEETIAGGDRWRLLGGCSVLRRSGEAGLRGTFSGRLELVSEHANLLLIPIDREVNALSNFSARATQLTFA